MTLAELFAEKGTSSGVVAVQINVSPVLFERVDEGRQPLPLAVARLAALAAGCTRSEVVVAAKSTTPLDGTRYRTPKPPRPVQVLQQPVEETPELATTTAAATVTVSSTSFSV